jgi:glutamate-5-semialdehyde dehydrogenase
MSITEISKNAKAASILMAPLSSDVKNTALAAIAVALKANSAKIIAENQLDLADAAKDNTATPLVKRLKFDQSKIADVCAGIESLINLEEPVGKTLEARELDKGLELYQVSCPIGVIGVIFESRPDALVQISTLCLKSGNGVLLKGGSEAKRTNRVLADIISEAAVKAGLPASWLGLLETRDDVAAMLGLDKYIDLIVPRGSNEFVQHIMKNTTIPVMGHADGICHVYVDSDAEADMAVNITVDSKTQYCAVCNALETLLVHSDIAETFLPKVKDALQAKGVEIYGCEKTAAIIDVKAATEEDWKTEYLNLTLSIKVV